MNLKKIFTKTCLNNDYIISMINKCFFKKFLSNYQIYKTLIFVIMREIDAIQHVSSNYVLLDLWLFDNDFNNLIIIHITREIYLINKLRVNILININIQQSRNITISISKRRFYIDNCVEFIIIINVVDVKKHVDRLIRIKKIISLSSHLIINVSIRIRDKFCLSINKNYIFYSKSISN